jgi:thymidylate synthase (FAD)
MSEVQMTTGMTVKAIQNSATDKGVILAAQASIHGENDPRYSEADPEKLINSLMKMRHGSPFEHNSMTFFAKVPIFVVREWMRHRISSFNEMSGRYTELLPEFWTPPEDRKMINVGTSMRPQMAPGSQSQRDLKKAEDLRIAEETWASYKRQLEFGISKELARTVLPLSIYTQFYWTVNARSLMNFLSLRVEDYEATVVSHPQKEIEIAAKLVEKEFARLMPITHEAFVKNGRVAP